MFYQLQQQPADEQQFVKRTKRNPGIGTGILFINQISNFIF